MTFSQWVRGSLLSDAAGVSLRDAPMLITTEDTVPFSLFDFF